MTVANNIALIGTGIALGIVHVLTGPDHLSALATLSATVPDFWTSFFLGVRWGVGHSTGLLMVGIVLIVHDFYHSRQEDDGQDTVEVPDFLSHLFESFVGVFMLFLGFYGLRQAFHKRNRLISSDSSSEDEEDYEELEGGSSFELKFKKEIASKPGTLVDAESQQVSLVSFADAVAEEYSYHHSHGVEPSEDVEIRNPCSTTNTTTTNGVFQSLFRSSRYFSIKTMAVFAGIIHGLAGPGGVLGVIPAVQLHDWKLACLYLGSFCISSTITMGCFASLYGTVTSCCGGSGTNLEFRIQCFSAFLSILVGITWLVLLSIGKLEDVFP